MSEAFESSGRKMAENADVLKECEALEGELVALKATYEQYFLGLEKRPPTDKHKDLKRRVGNLKGYFIRATALKFRVQGLAQKFATYERLWLRTLQEMENGTYHRDLARARRRKQAEESATAATPAERKPARDDFTLDEVSPEEADALLSGAFPSASTAPAPAPGIPPMAPAVAPVVAPVAAAAPAPASRPGAAGGVPRITAPTAAPRATPPQAAGGAALSDDKLRAVYDAYLQAKKRCNEDVSKISYDQVAQSLRKQVPELMQKHNAKAVEFKVVIKDGKAMLRAVPKEG